MKIIRLISAVVAALWTVGVAVGAFSQLGKHGGDRGLVDGAASFAALAIMLAITAWLFAGVFPKPQSPPTDQNAN
jgi:hypothetical protein